MPEMRLAGGRLYCDRGRTEVIVRAAHVAARRRFLVLLDGHVDTPFVVNSCLGSARAIRRTGSGSLARQHPRLPCIFRVAARTAMRGSADPRQARAPPSA